MADSITSTGPGKRPASDRYDTPMREFPLHERMLYRIVMAVLWAFTKLMWRWNLEGADRLHAGEGASVIICNHTSMAEVPCIVAHLWSKGRLVRPIFKSEFNRAGIVRWAFAMAGGIPVDRGTSDMSALRSAQHALRRGEDILIFPEGTRVRTDDQPVDMHGGFALIAQMGKAPVAPMAVCGFRDITPTGKRLMRPMKCWMRTAEMVRFEDAPSELSRRERTQWVQDESIKRMLAVRDELRSEHPGRF